MRVYGNIIKKMMEIVIVENELPRQKRWRERTQAHFVQRRVATPMPELSDNFVRWGLDAGINVTLMRRVLVKMFPTWSRVQQPWRFWRLSSG